jgi:hypothetical protein
MSGLNTIMVVVVLAVAGEWVRRYTFYLSKAQG